jgi:hypothetical protein
MTDDRIDAVTRATHTVARDGVVEIALDTDWPEGARHQTWLDSAPIAEVANWVLTVCGF